MDLIRKMSSGLRSSQDLSAARSNGGALEELEREGDEVPEQEDGDVYEDAAAATPGPQEQERDGKKGAPSPRVRAPVSDETEGLDNDENDENNEAGEGDDDGEGSYGSGESYDSALERMAASSTASYNTASSPKASSPVGSLKGPAVLGSPPSVMSVSQQGALMRLNLMLTGEDSLDTSLIDNSTEEEFHQRIAELAESRGQSADDASFGSIVDALLPLVLEKTDKKQSQQKSEDANSDFETSHSGDGEPRETKSPIPRTISTTEEESYHTDNDDANEGSQDLNGSGENGHESVDDHASGGKDEGLEELGVGEAEEQAEGDEPVEAVPQDGGGDAASGPEEVEDARKDRAMPKATLTPEDEGGGDEEAEGLEGGDGDNKKGAELSGDGQDEEGEGGKEDAQDVPMKIKALPSDVEAAGELPHAEKEGESEAPKENGDSKHVETDPAAEVKSEDSEGIDHATESQDSPGSPDETQAARPIAKATEDDAASPDAVGSDENEAVQEKIPESTSEALEEGSKDAAAPRELSDENPTQVDDDSNRTEEIYKILPQAQVEDEEKTVNADEREGIDEAGDSDDYVEEDDEEDGEADMEGSAEGSAALAALVRAADSPAAGVADTPSLGAAGPSLPARPTRSGRSSAPSLEPASRAVQQSRSSAAAPAQLSASADDSHTNGEAADGNEETREKLQVIRVKFLRLALRLGQSAHHVVVAQVLYRLGLAEQLRGGRNNTRSGAFSFDRASAIAEEQEAAGPEELDFTCTIMLLGKTGVGKSATINSMFDEQKTGTDAFRPSTNKVQVITGLVHGIKVRVIDTPGLLPSASDQRHNEKIMSSVKKFISKQAPDIVLYFDRLDMQSRDYGDLPLLRTITDTFGAAVWFNAIVVLTHASSAPPDGPNGLPLSYEMFVAQRSHVVQQTIRQAAGDMRLMNPVSLVENHPACRVNRSGQRVLPNGQVWKPQLLLLCFASKILAEANSLLKLQDNTPGRPFGSRTRAPPLPFLLSSLLQSRAQLSMPDEQIGEEDESDEELEEDEDSDEEEDYDQLPPFRRLAKEEVAELDEDNRGKYFEELAERERLFQLKQWKEEKRRRRELKKRMAESPMDQSQFVDDGLSEEEMARSAAVPVPMPDMVLPPSFDSDNPSHRYRYLETANQWLVRPVLETHGWDHDNGYDGMSVEKMFVLREKIPASVSGQITKDKKDSNVNMEAAASFKHGDGKVTLAGLDLQTVGKDSVAYTLRSETRFNNYKGNKTTGGLAMTLLGDTVSAGMKLEDRLVIGKRVKLVLNGGAITGGGDVAYGGSLEATLRDKDYPLSRTLSSLGLSIMDWHGDLALGGNLQSQFVLGKTMMVGRANLNNRGAGQISIRASSSEQLQMALIGLLPIIRSLVNRLLGSQSEE